MIFLFLLSEVLSEELEGPNLLGLAGQWSEDNLFINYLLDQDDVK